MLNIVNVLNVNETQLLKTAVHSKNSKIVQNLGPAIASSVETMQKFFKGTTFTPGDIAETLVEIANQPTSQEDQSQRVATQHYLAEKTE